MASCCPVVRARTSSPEAAAPARHRAGSPGSRLKRWALWLWASPNTLVGLAFALTLLPFGARLRLVDGVIEVAALQRAPNRPWPFAAITLGHVVLGSHAQELHCWRAHERVHVRQCERWGPLFLPAYLLAGLWQWMRGRRAYWDNPFEVEARSGGAVKSTGSAT